MEKTPEQPAVKPTPPSANTSERSFARLTEAEKAQVWQEVKRIEAIQARTRQQIQKNEAAQAARDAAETKLRDAATVKVKPSAELLTEVQREAFKLMNYDLALGNGPGAAEQLLQELLPISRPPRPSA